MSYQLSALGSIYWSKVLLCLINSYVFYSGIGTYLKKLHVHLNNNWHHTSAIGSIYWSKVLLCLINSYVSGTGISISLMKSRLLSSNQEYLSRIIGRFIGQLVNRFYNVLSILMYFTQPKAIWPICLSSAPHVGK